MSIVEIVSIVIVGLVVFIAAIRFGFLGLFLELLLSLISGGGSGGSSSGGSSFGGGDSGGGGSSSDW